MSTAGRDVRELRGQIRHWRRGRVDTSLVEAFTDAYVVIFSAIVLGAMAVSVIVNLRVGATGSCTALSCLDARDALGWLFGLGAAALVLAVARLLGPMLVSPAVGTWLLTTPLDRTTLVRGRLALSAVAGAVAAATVAAVGATLSGYPAPVVGWFTGVFAAGGVLLVGVATVAQARRHPAVRVLSWLLGGALWVGLVLVAVDAVPSTLRAPTAPRLVLALVVVGSLAVLALVAAYRDLRLIGRDRLVSGGALLPGLSGALASLDLTLLYDILVSRHWRARSSVRVVRGRGTGTSALVWREVVRLRRSPQVLVALAGSLVLPYLAATLGLGHAMLLVVTLTGFVAGVGLLTSLRVLSRTASLLRCFPLPASAVRWACLGVPGGVLVLWGAAATPAVHDAVGGAWADSVATALACGLVVATSAVRWMTSRPPDYRLPLITSPMGAVPTSLYFSVLRGFDVLLLGTVPLLVAPTTNGAAVSAALMAAVLSFLVSRP
ncbi:DUF6297 family protein [Nocardioides sp. URHA0020]|uniref:DUF6297 family protein n=1 Tax=Nocardioides sp. URHA0020 TaxID=1380392 RepID=UPI000490380B|nr:DUF6297 family protein [Nocardioides sp. URHA0020]